MPPEHRQVQAEDGQHTFRLYYQSYGESLRYMKAFPLLVFIFAFAYITAARAETVTVNHPDGSKSVTVVDSRNNPLETSDYNVDGSLVKKSIFERDDKGKLLKMIVQSPDGKVKRTENYSYDQKGHLITTRRTDRDGSVWIRQEMYDEHDNHLQSRIIDPKGWEATLQEWERAE
jgi:hypothetical protein